MRVSFPPGRGGGAECGAAEAGAPSTGYPPADPGPADLVDAVAQVAPVSRALDVVAAALLVSTFWAPTWELEPLVVLPGGLLAAITVTCMLFRWRLPWTCTALAFVAAVAGLALGLSEDPFLGTAWCLYAAAVHRRHRLGTMGLLGCGMVLFVTMVAGMPSDLQARLQTGLVGVGSLAGSWLLGRSEGQRLMAADTVMRMRADRERMSHQLRLARDLHDGVGHSLTLIVAEADIARSLSPTDEGAAQDALANIEAAAREALRETQVVVRVMRGQGPLTADVKAAQVVPGMAAQARAAGLSVGTDIDVPPDLPPEVEVAATRVVQEALSNVLRHANAERCDIALWCEGEALHVRVDDDGVGLGVRAGDGSGLAGMRERIHDVGGELTVAGGRRGRGVQVTARIPLRRAS